MPVQRGGGASWGEAMTVARGMHESFTLVQRLGYRLYPAGKARLHALPSWIVAMMLWGVSRIASFRDLLATGAGESRALVDTMVAAAGGIEPPFDTTKILAMRPSSPRT